MCFPACSLRLALCCPPPALCLFPQLFRLTQKLCNFLSLRLQLRLLLASAQFSFSQFRLAQLLSLLLFSRLAFLLFPAPP
jgi:hypothetical protein